MMLLKNAMDINVDKQNSLNRCLERPVIKLCSTNKVTTWTNIKRPIC